MALSGIDEKLLGMNTAFIGKIVGFDGANANVQPLNLMKQLGRPPEKRALVTNVPILEHVRHLKPWRYTDPATGNWHEGHVSFEPLKVGDIVFCVCADRDISETRKGKSALPAIGHHMIKDAVIVGCLNGG